MNLTSNIQFHQLIRAMLFYFLNIKAQEDVFISKLLGLGKV